MIAKSSRRKIGATNANSTSACPLARRDRELDLLPKRRIMAEAA